MVGGVATLTNLQYCSREWCKRTTTEACRLKRNSLSIGDPFLSSVDNPLLAILALHSRSLRSHNVTTGVCLRNRETDKFLASENIEDNLNLKIQRKGVM